MDASIVTKYFPDLTATQRTQLEALGPLYADWNAKINVVSRKDIEELYERHVLHSLAIAKFAAFEKVAKILDLGTGGGFPGVPLAILFPECTFHLVDSIGKKITVVQEVATAIGLTNLTSEHNRVEKVKGPYNFIVSRAVAPAKQLMQWTHHLIKASAHPTLSNGYLLLKGGNLVEELMELKRPYVMKAIPDYFSEPFFETKKVIYIPV